MARFEFYDLPPKIKAGLVRLRAEVAGNHVLLAGLRCALLLRKANFNPNQPRAPRGGSDGGRWAGTDNTGGANESNQTTPKEPPSHPPLILPHAIGHGSDLGDPPRIPKEQPASRAVRHAIIKASVKWIAKVGLRSIPYVGEALVAMDAAQWAAPYVRSYFDAPKSLGDLQQAISTPAAGYEIHHIVEQGPARQSENIPPSLIDSKDNLVAIPYLKHHEITGWFATPNEDFGGISPREYLRGKSWDEQMRVGKDALRKLGVLKP